MEDYNTPTVDIVEQKYDPALLDNIKRILEIQVQAGKPQTYEIEVDGLRVVPRTTVTEVFDTYKTFVHPTTKKIKVIVYRGVKTPACTTHVFNRELQIETPVLVQQVQPIQQPGFLNGTEVQNYVREILEKDRMTTKIVSLEEKVQERDKKIKEAEDYIAKLQNGIELAMQEKEKSKTPEWMERLIKLIENPPSWVPPLIAGKAFSQSMSGTETKTQEQGDASFSKKKKESALTDSDKEYLEVKKLMEDELNEDQFITVMRIERKLSEEPDLISTVADLVEIGAGEN